MTDIEILDACPDRQDLADMPLDPSAIIYLSDHQIAHPQAMQIIHQTPPYIDRCMPQNLRNIEVFEVLESIDEM